MEISSLFIICMFISFKEYGMVYTHLTLEERAKIELLWNQGKRMADIARVLGRHRSTISREIRRTQDFDDYKEFMPKKRMKILRYNARSAELKSRRRKQNVGRRSLYSSYNSRKINKYLLKKYSPEQIACGTKDVTVSTNTIYNWIYLGKLKLKRSDLRRKRRRKGKRVRASENELNRELIKNRSIELRPKEANDRSEFGHWELDTILPKRGSKDVIATFSERKTRLLFAVKIKSRSGIALIPAIDTFMSLYGEYAKSITCDHGTEFANSTLVRQIENYGVHVYFAHPYAPHERGSNENLNGLLREYIPKKTSFSKLSQAELKTYVNELNDRPKNWGDLKMPKNGRVDKYIFKNNV